MKPNFDLSIYLVTDRDLMSTTSLEEAVTEAIRGGCTLVQLREKNLSSRDFYMVALSIKRLTDSLAIPLIINDRVDIALAVDAAGVHVGQSDLPACEVRRIIGAEKILGVSASTLAEAAKAQLDDADYVGVGAMFATGTKTDAKSVTIGELCEIKRSLRIPVVAIGGINEQSLPMLYKTGIDGIAVVSGIISNQNIAASANQLKQMFKQVKLV